MRSFLLVLVLDFYPRSPCGERHFDRDQQDGNRPDFYPRSPCGERRCQRGPGVPDFYFYPRSPCGERPCWPPMIAPAPPFLSTLSLRRATQRHRDRKGPGRNFYPRSPCGERPANEALQKVKEVISIHALLAESDNNFKKSVSVALPFLSTLSLRRAT